MVDYSRVSWLGTMLVVVVVADMFYYYYYNAMVIDMPSTRRECDHGWTATHHIPVANGQS